MESFWLRWKNLFLRKRSRKKQILFLYPVMDIRRWQRRRRSYTDRDWLPFVLPSGRYSVVTGKFSGVLAKEDVYDEDYETEWEFLKEVLVKNGVPMENILREDQATFTYENAIYSRQVTDSRNMKIEKAILCCKAYHARRCLMYYQLLYPDTEFFVVPVDADGITRENWLEGEEGINAVTGEVSRIVKQFSLMLKKQE